ncbi:peroxiredoxin [Deinococcus sp.]|uniref:peroxiredoxin n=1 Tax=Deinococcus sp. TaxID=47478 RepID=UPI0025D476D9|nr:peroxiredoxin [Deinococcus sp.]
MTAPDNRPSVPTRVLKPGQNFPEFDLPDGQGVRHSLAQTAGGYLVLYVYPKDSTPGCTREACDFRDNQALRSHGAVIMGVSMDDAASHQAFAAEHSLPFPLLSDPSAEFLRRIGAYGPRNVFGKVGEGIRRSTFLVGPGGELVRAWYDVKVEGHVGEVVAAIEADETGAAQAGVRG